MNPWKVWAKTTHNKVNKYIQSIYLSNSLKLILKWEWNREFEKLKFISE